MTFFNISKTVQYHKRHSKKHPPQMTIVQFLSVRNACNHPYCKNGIKFKILLKSTVLYILYIILLIINKNSNNLLVLTH